MLALTLTLALFPVWPNLPNTIPTVGQILIWTFSEVGLGLAIGLAVSFLMEDFNWRCRSSGCRRATATRLQLIRQARPIQRPAGDADAHHGVAILHLRIRPAGDSHPAASFERFPAGSWAPTAASLDGIVRLGGNMLIDRRAARASSSGAAPAD